MKKLLNSKIPNAISMIVMVLFIMICCVVYAEDPDGIISDMEQDLLNAVVYLSPCATKNHQLVNYIDNFKAQIFETCQWGGIIKGVDSNGESVLFYCSKAFEL